MALPSPFLWCFWPSFRLSAVDAALWRPALDAARLWRDVQSDGYLQVLTAAERAHPAQHGRYIVRQDHPFASRWRSCWPGFCARTDTPIRGALEVLITLPFFIPPILTAMAWGMLGNPQWGCLINSING